MNSVHEVALCAGVALFFVLCAIWLPWLECRRSQKERSRQINEAYIGLVEEHTSPEGWKRECDRSLERSRVRRQL